MVLGWLATLSVAIRKVSFAQPEGMGHLGALFLLCLGVCLCFAIRFTTLSGLSR